MKFFCTALFLMLLTGCSSISGNSTWKDPEYTGGTITNLAVRVIDSDAIVGSTLEKLLCSEIGRNGITASHLDPMAALDVGPEEENSPAKLARTGVQAVLMGRAGDRQPTQVQPPSKSKIDPYAGPDPSRGRRILNSTQDMEHWQYTCCLIGTMKPIWTASIDVHIDELADRAEKLKPSIKVIVEQLKQSGLVKPAAQ
jgi:hypothetical protein